MFKFIRNKLKERKYKKYIIESGKAVETIHQIAQGYIVGLPTEKNIDLKKVTRDVIKHYNSKNKIRIPQRTYDLVEEIIKLTILGKKPAEIKTKLAGAMSSILLEVGKDLFVYLIKKYLTKGLI